MATAVRKSPRALSLPQGFAVSGLIHGAVAAAVLAVVSTLPERPREEALLAMELQTLLAESTEPTPPAPPVQPPPVPKVPPTVEAPQPVKLPKPPRAPKPVRVASPVKVAETAAVREAAPAAEAAPSAPAPSDADRALSLYAAQLRRRLTNALALSQEVRRAGLDGVVTIGFAVDETGQLIAETLRVVRSSGSAVLDRNALAVVAATPMEPPPPTSIKPLRMNVDLVFRL